MFIAYPQPKVSLLTAVKKLFHIREAVASHPWVSNKHKALAERTCSINRRNMRKQQKKPVEVAEET